MLIACIKLRELARFKNKCPAIGLMVTRALYCTRLPLSNITVSSEIALEAPQIRQKAIMLVLGQQTVTQKRRRKFKPEKQAKINFYFSKATTKKFLQISCWS
jgi:hypothetical protein